MTGLLGLKEFNRVDTKGDCIADEGEVRCCGWNRTYRGRFEVVVENWQEKEQGEDERGHYCINVNVIDVEEQKRDPMRHTKEFTIRNKYS
jgi:hypothetical protein